MNQNYVGCRKGDSAEPFKREVFKAETTPTPTTHGERYYAVIGPFRTRRGADFMAQHGEANPHCQNVADAERLARTG
jgi:hypothetical protein|tara:strand:- start:686 stop:916 length:231 start_codon:yes stop_codon:yes gene_type:complete